MALAIAEHCSMLACDHIGEACTAAFSDCFLSVSKYLGAVIRYFSDTKQTIVTTFLGLVELEGGDAKSIARAVVAFLEKCCLKKEKLLGIRTDNASVMTGINNGVHKVLKEEYGLKYLVLIHCVCNTLQLAHL